MLGAALACAGAAWAPLTAAQAPQVEGTLLPEGELDLQLGFEQSRGHYGQAQESLLRSLALVVRLRTGAWRLEAEAPWLELRDAPTAPDGDGAVAHGLGDVWLRASRELRELTAEQGGLDLTLKFKAATGDPAHGLGSGARDWALQLEGTKLLGRWLAYGSLGWRHTGDVPGLRPYANPWYGDLGVQRTFASNLDAGSFWSTRQAVGRLGPLRELTLYAAWRGERDRMQLHLSRGFAEASPELALGLTLRRRF